MKVIAESPKPRNYISDKVSSFLCYFMALCSHELNDDTFRKVGNDICRSGAGLTRIRIQRQPLFALIKHLIGISNMNMNKGFGRGTG